MLNWMTLQMRLKKYAGVLASEHYEPMMWNTKIELPI